MAALGRRGTGHAARVDHLEVGGNTLCRPCKPPCQQYGLQVTGLRMVYATAERRDAVLPRIREIPGMTCIEPRGAFYAFPSVEGLLGRDFGGFTASTSLELGAIVLEQIKVAFVPGEAFGAPGYVRFSFALGDDDLVEGLERLGAFFS